MTVFITFGRMHVHIDIAFGPQRFELRYILGLVDKVDMASRVTSLKKNHLRDTNLCKPIIPKVEEERI